MRHLYEAYQLGINIRNNFYQTDLVTIIEQVNHSFDAIEDGYPDWHPAPLSFRGMVLAFVFMEITGESYAAFTRRLRRQPEAATVFGFSRVPGESAFSRAWRNRFDDVHEYVQTAAHFVVKEVHDSDIPAPEVRPKSEIVEDAPEKQTMRNTRSQKTKLSERLVLRAITASDTLSLDAPQTRRMTTLDFSSCRRSWEWSAAALPKELLDFSIDAVIIMDHSVTPSSCSQAVLVRSSR